MTTNYIIVIDASNTLKAIKKSDGTEIILASNVSNVFTFMNGAFWNEVDSTNPSNPVIKSCYWEEGDSQATCQDNRLWVGFSLKRSLDIDNWN